MAKELFQLSSSIISGNQSLLEPGGSDHSVLVALARRTGASEKQREYKPLSSHLVCDGSSVIHYFGSNDNEAKLQRLTMQGLTVGSLVSFSQIEPFQVGNLTSLPGEKLKQFFDETERFGVVIGRTSVGNPVLRSVMPMAKKWSERFYSIDGQTREPQKVRALSALIESLNSEEGTEGGAVAYAVIGGGKAIENAKKRASQAVNSIACAMTHINPTEGINQSLEANSYPLADVELVSKPGLLVRINLSPDGFMPSSLTQDQIVSGKLLDRSRIQTLGLLDASLELARLNPTEMGGGTSPAKVLEANFALFQAVQADSSITLNAAWSMLADNLGVNRMPWQR